MTVAVNPGKTIPGLFDVKTGLYSSVEAPPHCFTTAHRAYQSIMENGENQCIVLSGESGSGKSETFSNVLKYLTELSLAATPEIDRKYYSVVGDSSVGGCVQH